MENKLYDIFKKLFSWVKNASRQQASKDLFPKDRILLNLFFSRERSML